MRIKITRIELYREILESYTKCSCNVNSSYEIIQHICEDLDIPVSENYCYISDLLKYLLETKVIILNDTQINIIIEFEKSVALRYGERFKEVNYFKALIEKDVLPSELLNIKIGYVLNKIKESRGE